MENAAIKEIKSAGVNALQNLISNPYNREAVLLAINWFSQDSQLAKQIEYFAFQYLYNFPDDKEILAKLITAQKASYDRLLNSSIIRDTNYQPKQHKVSAIISCWKARDFIEECLGDLEAQTIADSLEIIFVDPASPDREGEIVESFQQRFGNIRYIRTPERISVYEAWNLAIHVANGKYLTTFSSNDRLNPRAYEILSTVLDNNERIALAYGDSYATDVPHQRFDKFTYSKKIHGGWRYNDYSFFELLNYCIVGPHPMWRRAMHDSKGFFNRRYKAFGDQDMWLRIASADNFQHIDEITGLFWFDDNSLSNAPQNAWEKYEIKSMHQNIFLARHYKNRLPSEIPCQEVRRYLEKSFKKKVAFDYRYKDFVPPENSEMKIQFLPFAALIDVINQLLAGKHIQPAIQYFDTYKCLFISEAEFPQISKKMEELRKAAL